MAGEPIQQSKTCTKCGADKPLNDFYKSKLGKFGRDSACKACSAEESSRHNRLKRLADPEGVRERQRRWRVENRPLMKKIKAAAYRKNAEAVKKKSQEWNERNHERRSVNQRAWRDKNREKVRASQRQARARLRATPKGRLELSIGSTLRSSLKTGKGGRRTFVVLGYTVEQLMRHLEKQFTSGMSWENHGIKGWHVDHIIPLSAHNYESVDDIDFKRAWALKNLRPLWAEDNHRKSKTLLAPFQPSLLL